MSAIRTGVLATGMLVAALFAGSYPTQPAMVTDAPVLVGCSDGTRCAVTTRTGPTRTIDIHWVPAPTSASDDPGSAQ